MHKITRFLKFQQYLQSLYEALLTYVLKTRKKNRQYEIVRLRATN